jgi:hypothetical protein
MKKVIVFFATIILGSALYASVDVFPYKADLFLGTSHTKTLSSFMFHAKQIFPIKYSNHSKMGLTFHDGELGYLLSYEQNHPNGLASASFGSKFKFVDPILEQHYTYPSATYLAGTWHGLTLHQWLLDSDRYTMIHLNKLIWLSSESYTDSDGKDELNKTSIGGKLHLPPLNMTVIGQAHNFSLSNTDTAYSGALLKIKYTPKPLQLLPDIFVKPVISYTQLENNAASQGFVPQYSQYGLTTFHSLLTEHLYKKSLSIISTKFVFQTKDPFTPYIKTSSYSGKALVGTGFLYQWRENAGLQVEAEHNNLEGGVGIWARLVLFDRLII